MCRCDASPERRRCGAAAAMARQQLAAVGASTSHLGRHHPFAPSFRPNQNNEALAGPEEFRPDSLAALCPLTVSAATLHSAIMFHIMLRPAIGPGFTFERGPIRSDAAGLDTANDANQPNLMLAADQTLR